MKTITLKTYIKRLVLRRLIEKFFPIEHNLKGTADLVIRNPDGSVELRDWKTRPGVSGSQFTLFFSSRTFEPLDVIIK